MMSHAPAGKLILIVWKVKTFEGTVRIIVSMSATVDGGLHAPSLEKQRGAPAWKLSNVLLWMESATKGILAT